MKITKKWLKNKESCQEGIDWFGEQTESNGLLVVQEGGEK